MHNGSRHKTPLALLVAALLIITTPLGLAGCSSGNGVTKITSPTDIGLSEVEIAAPDFTLPILGGGDLRLSDLQGQVVLLNFWYLDCPPCKEEMPYLDAVGKAYEGRAHVVVLNIGDSESSVERYFGDAELNMRVPFDFDGRIAAEYSIGFTPTTFFIDSDGIIRFAKIGGFHNYDEVAAAMEFILAKDAE